MRPIASKSAAARGTHAYKNIFPNGRVFLAYLFDRLREKADYSLMADMFLGASLHLPVQPFLLLLCNVRAYLDAAPLWSRRFVNLETHGERIVGPWLPTDFVPVKVRDPAYHRVEAVVLLPLHPSASNKG